MPPRRREFRRSSWERSRAEHPWYFEETGGAIGRGGLCQDVVAIERRTQRVLSRARGGSAGSGDDTRSVRLLHLVRVGENRAQLRGESRALVVGELEPCERRDPIDIGLGEDCSHGH